MPKVTESYKNQRRVEILQAAQKVFEEKGFASMVMQDVIDMTGHSRGAIYSYFANKEELYRSVIEYADEEGLWPEFDTLRTAIPLWPALCEHLSYESTSTPDEERIRKSIGAQFEYVTSGRTDDERTQWVFKRYEKILYSYVEIIESASKRGEFRPRMPIVDIVQFMVSSNDGMNFARMMMGPTVVNFVGQNVALISFLTYALQPIGDSSGD